MASASPRRKELLRQVGLAFITDPSHYVEDTPPETASPHELARSLSLEKAGRVAARHQDALVIAADTFIVFKNQILGKPHSAAEARKMLKALNGKAHSVITGFTVTDTESCQSVSRSVETKVYLKKLTPAEIGSYVGSGEPGDKAGAYAIQGLGAIIVERIEGDYFNVVGLPLKALAEALKQFGIDLLEVASALKHSASDC